jgi:oligopeptide/dipeptide ABC transporter ATP-binding protein
MKEPLLRVQGLSKHFPVTRGVFGRVHAHVHAVDDVSFDLYEGETMGLVGESGCGKSTVGRTLLHLHEPTAGQVWFAGRRLDGLTAEELKQARREMQIVFQDPYSSLNPRMRVFDIVGEALQVHGVAKGEELRRRVYALLEQVGVSPRWADRYAHEFSGGQRQRIGIARAIALHPKLLVCDEAVSALDVSIQAQIINLLIELRRRLGLSYLFISHDLSVVRHISQRVMVMYLGQVVELGPTREIFERAAHPYTRALLSAVPVADPRRKPQRVVLHGDVPSPLAPPSGCRFHTRCPAVFERCSREVPALYTLGTSGRTVRCFHSEGLEQAPDWYEQVVRRISEAEQAQAERNRQAVDIVARNLAVLEQQRLQPEPPLDETFVREDANGDGPSVDSEGVGRRHRGMLALVALVVLVVGGSLVRDVARHSRAQRELRALAFEVEDYKRVSGAYPNSLGELGYRLGFVFGTRRANDPWGTPYQYNAAQQLDDASAGSPARASTPAVVLWSNGPDGAPATRDDLRAPLSSSAQSSSQQLPGTQASAVSSPPVSSSPLGDNTQDGTD